MMDAAITYNCRFCGKEVEASEQDRANARTEAIEQGEAHSSDFPTEADIFATFGRDICSDCTGEGSP